MNIADRPELADRLAAAYALGTLRGGARRRFEAIARQAPSVRLRVMLWNERFASMTELQPQQDPGPNVWKRIENLLAAEPAAAPAAPDPGMAARLRRALVWWKGATAIGALGTAAAVTLVVGLTRTLDRQEAALAEANQQRETLLAQARSTADVRYVAVLIDEGQRPHVVVTFDARSRSFTLRHVAPLQVQPDRSLELWTIPPGQGPRSLGVLAEGTVVRLPAAQAEVGEGPTLAVTLEPKGGAPGPGPTGPVLFKGALLQTSI